jgi:hypothetical protein
VSAGTWLSHLDNIKLTPRRTVSSGSLSSWSLPLISSSPLIDSQSNLSNRIAAPLTDGAAMVGEGGMYSRCTAGLYLTLTCYTPPPWINRRTHNASQKSEIE